jgi:hypothetical protein
LQDLYLIQAMAAKLPRVLFRDHVQLLSCPTCPAPFLTF